MGDAEEKLFSLMQSENTHVSEILEAYFDCHDLLEMDDTEYEEYFKVYSYNDLNSFVDRLEIKNNEMRWQMALAIMAAASRYDAWSKRSNQKPTQKEYKASMKRLNSALRKAYKELSCENDCEDANAIYQWHFTQALKDKVAQRCKNSHSIYNMSSILRDINLRSHISGPEIGLLLEVMAEVAKQQYKHPPFETAKHEEPIHAWVTIISSSWQKYSDAPLKTAKYYKDIGYVSDQMKILEDIMAPLDPSVTNVQIGHALKSYLSCPEGSESRLYKFS